MSYHFRISPLSYKMFSSYFDMSEEELKVSKAVIQTVDKKPGFPCRVSLEDADIGEEVLLINFTHREHATPFDADGPIYIRKNAIQNPMKINKFPENIMSRMISLRGYDENEMMIETNTIKGSEFTQFISQMLKNPDVHYLHVHFSGPGCYYFQVDRTND